ncbi:iron dicitrate transport regulator FecR [Rugamonas sp. FT107W]|uniref:Iron dicitrate transport regulator FecR n=1 Tax=Duganella vulcania TaxID=2692166 RepID=A0A845HUF3_9BURK|nr:FecR family protein [Duganella vulcania]MYN21135.1 iron dicitrate transport regulator FecR [Duganella vulcania]
MSQPKNSLVVRALLKGLLLLALCGLAGAGWAAQVVGTVVQLSGPLLSKKADGVVRILSMRSEVESGDMLVTEKNTYAMVKFIDNSEITLKPGTTFKVENFSYDAGKPEADNASFNLVKGGLRSVTGLLGKRNKEKFAMKTPSATIGIRGTTFIADIVEPGEEAVASRLAYNLASTAALDRLAAPVQPLMLAQLTLPSPTAARAPGLYVQVLDGLIHVTNPAGTSNFSAGQFGYTPSFRTPPVILPVNPGIQFTPPPAFSQSTGPSSSTGPGKSNIVDCEVR